MPSLISAYLWLQGKKSYFLAAALFAYAIGGYFSGHLPAQQALELIYSSSVVASLRAAIAKASTTPAKQAQNN